MIKNGVYIIVREFVVAELCRILVYADYMTCDRLTITVKECKITKPVQIYKAHRVKML